MKAPSTRLLAYIELLVASLPHLLLATALHSLRRWWCSHLLTYINWSGYAPCEVLTSRSSNIYHSFWQSPQNPINKHVSVFHKEHAHHGQNPKITKRLVDDFLRQDRQQKPEIPPFDKQAARVPGLSLTLHNCIHCNPQRPC